MKLFIPSLGDVLILSNIWNFKIFKESRNNKFITSLLNISSQEIEPYYNISLPEKTILIIDRIYIKKNGEDYNSISFRCELPNGIKGRFWAKLSDVNNIEFNENQIIDRKKEVQNLITSFKNNTNLIKILHLEKNINNLNDLKIKITIESTLDFIEQINIYFDVWNSNTNILIRNFYFEINYFDEKNKLKSIKSKLMLYNQTLSEFNSYFIDLVKNNK